MRPRSSHSFRARHLQSRTSHIIENWRQDCIKAGLNFSHVSRDFPSSLMSDRRSQKSKGSSASAKSARIAPIISSRPGPDSRPIKPTATPSNPAKRLRSNDSIASGDLSLGSREVVDMSEAGSDGGREEIDVEDDPESQLGKSLFLCSRFPY
jgi:hypothetical protein